LPFEKKGIEMRKTLMRIFPMSFLFATLFVGVFSGSALASAKSMHIPSHARNTTPLQLMLCLPISPSPNFTHVDGGGNASGCANQLNPSTNQLNPSYYTVSQKGTRYSAKWTLTGDPDQAITFCDIKTWIPSYPSADDTKVRYDFWNDNGSHWLGWVGEDINQQTTKGWVQIGGRNGSPLSIQRTDVEVTAQDDGGTGDIGFAAMKFTCTETPILA
jgi:hypothetical protein